MTKYMLLKSSCIALSTALLLSACGGGGSSSSSTSSSKTSKTAYLIDAAVSGVKYVNSDGSTGFTASDGSFTYVEGKTEFFVGKVKIGEISSSTSDSKFYVQDVVGVERTNINDPKVLKVATFLQSIDSNPSTKEIEVADNFNDFNDVEITLTQDSSDVNQILTRKSFTVKTENEVKQHLRTELASNNIVADTIAPTVTKTNLTGQVEVSSNLNITFSEKMSLDSFTSNNIILKEKATDTLFATSISFNNSNNTLSIKPNVNLDNQKEYVLTLKDSISDNNGNKLSSDLVYNFTTALELDSSKPTVLMLSETSNIKLNEALKLQFSEEIKESTLNGNVILRDSGNNTLTTTLSFDNSKNILTITPNNLLSAATEYTIKVKNALTDLAGNSLYTSSNDEKSFTFETLNLSDATKPTVNSTSLDSNSSSVAINSNITITFSKEIDASTLEGNVLLQREGLNVSINKPTLNGNILTIDPISNLLKNKQYSVVLKNQIKDTFGQNLDYNSDKTYTFTTEQEVDNTRPELIDAESSIKNNDSNVEANASFSFTFNEAIKESTLDSGIELKDANGSNITFTKTYNHNVLTITPSSNLNYASAYTLKLTTAITDLAGNAFDGNKFSSSNHDKVISFITKADPSDTTAPSLTSANNMGTKTVEENIVITFNERLNEENLASKINISHSGYRVSYSGNTITLTPSTTRISPTYINTTVEYDTDYTVTLNRNISDLAGNKLGSDILVTFHTQKEADTTAPQLDYINPINNTTNISADKNIVVTFNEPLKNEGINASTFTLTTEDDTNTNLITDSNISLASNIITIDPSSNLNLGTKYIFKIKSGVLKDTSDNTYSGFGDKTINFTTRSNSSSVTCDSGYLEYNNACFKIYTEKKNWEDAKAHCVTNNSTLLSNNIVKNNENSFASMLNLDTKTSYTLLELERFGNYAQSLAFSRPLAGYDGDWVSSNSVTKTETSAFICQKN